MTYLEIEDAMLTGERRQLDSRDDEIRRARRQHQINRENAEKPLQQQRQDALKVQDDLRDTVQNLDISELSDHYKSYQSGLPLLAAGTLNGEKKTKFAAAIKALNIHTSQVLEDVAGFKRHVWYLGYLANYEERLDKLNKASDSAQAKYDAAKAAADSAKEKSDSAYIAFNDFRNTEMSHRLLKGAYPRLFDDPAGMADQIYRQNKRLSARTDALLSTPPSNGK